VLAVSHVSRSFSGIRALADASLDVRAGEIHALVGENGAGKSTLVRILTGALEPDGGTVEFDGHRITRTRRSRRGGSAWSPFTSTRRSFPISASRRTWRSASKRCARGRASTGPHEDNGRRRCSTWWARGSTSIGRQRR
jgi:ABC-type Mn2+/Zn2+ transport system ATPase subunit